ncbi:MAG: Serine/threonine-protein kinase PknD [Phycisphaerae bacterium]|nr:Serine/threonine-protein kinase PknD [Phycisphaerae bacterium]
MASSHESAPRPDQPSEADALRDARPAAASAGSEAETRAGNSDSASGEHPATLTSSGISTITAGDAAEHVGAAIGRYRLLQQLGEGGFGSVFLAEQREPVARKVALKIIKLGMDTRAVIARFEAERQALALMDHPSIAKVFDAGATETGRPYFVMELVRGEPITDYCDKNNLSVRDRLGLFAQVCQAVQHAHTKGVIHRDIKPSNVLVSAQDSRPVAKVIDFGIAKATSSKLTEKTYFTEHRQLIGTPQYMSPEQAEGSLDIDTRTDVYSLGVLLYELLTGTTPFDARSLRSAAYGEIQRIIREVEPPKPSTRLSERARTRSGGPQTDTRKFGSHVRGELDWIVMKALEKDRSRRYETANGLAADVLRYLSGEAVVAAPPSRTYLVRKFIGRHRGAVTAAALVVAALVLGIVGTSVGLARAELQRKRAIAAQAAEAAQRALAETRLQESEATVKFLDDMLGAADPNVQGKDVTVRSVLDRAASSLAAEFKDRPLVAARLHGTIGSTYLNLGDYDAAEAHLREALSTWTRELGREHPDTCRAVAALGGVLVKKARFAEAEQLLTQALAEHERLFGRRHEITALTLDALTQCYLLMERRREALGLARELLEIRTDTLGREHTDTVSAMNTLALLYADLGRFDDAEKVLEEALQIQVRLTGPEHPAALGIRANLAWMLYSVAMAGMKQTDPEGYQRRLSRARVLNEETLAARTRILGEEHPGTLDVMNNLGTVYKALGMFDDADRLALKDIEISSRRLGEKHPDTIASIANMGSYLRARGRFEDAIVYLDRALKNAREALPADAQGLAFILGWYGSCLGALHRYAEGEPMLLEARAIIDRTLGEDHPIAGSMAHDLADLYRDWDKAEPGKGYDAKSQQWRATSQPASTSTRPAATTRS